MTKHIWVSTPKVILERHKDGRTSVSLNDLVEQSISLPKWPAGKEIVFVVFVVINNNNSK